MAATVPISAADLTKAVSKGVSSSMSQRLGTTFEGLSLANSLLSGASGSGGSVPSIQGGKFNIQDQTELELIRQQRFDELLAGVLAKFGIQIPVRDANKAAEIISARRNRNLERSTNRELKLKSALMRIGTLADIKKAEIAQEGQTDREVLSQIGQTRRTDSTNLANIQSNVEVANRTLGGKFLDNTIGNLLTAKSYSGPVELDQTVNISY